MGFLNASFVFTSPLAKQFPQLPFQFSIITSIINLESSGAITIIMIRVAIVEDTEKWRTIVKSYLQTYGKEKGVDFLIETFDRGEALLSHGTEMFDLVFMDIDLPERNGIDTSKALRVENENTCLVFLTELPQFAVQGYEVNAFDFLIKPIGYDLFCVKLARILNHIDKSAVKTYMVKDGNEARRLRYSEILYFESQKHYIYFHLGDGSVIKTRATLMDIQDDFLGNGFSKINRSIIVNLSKIDGYGRDDIRIGNEKLPLSRIYRTSFLAELNTFLGRGQK